MWTLLLIIAILVCLTVVGGEEPCKEGWLRFDNKCYYFSKDQTDYKGMLGDCFKRKAFPISILNEEESDFITSHLVGPTWLGLIHEDPIRIGDGTLRERREGWRWLDDSLYLWFNWQTGSGPTLLLSQPLLGSGLSRIQEEGFWDDVAQLDHELYYICKKAINNEDTSAEEAGETTSPPGQPPSGQPTDATDGNLDGHLATEESEMTTETMLTSNTSTNRTGVVVGAIIGTLLTTVLMTLLIIWIIWYKRHSHLSHEVKQDLGQNHSYEKPEIDDVHYEDIQDSVDFEGKAKAPLEESLYSKVTKVASRDDEDATVIVDNELYDLSPIDNDGPLDNDVPLSNDDPLGNDGPLGMELTIEDNIIYDSNNP